MEGDMSLTLSVIGRQVSPPSVVFHTPPLTASTRPPRYGPTSRQVNPCHGPLFSSALSSFGVGEASALAADVSAFAACDFGCLPLFLLSFSCATRSELPNEAANSTIANIASKVRWITTTGARDIESSGK